MAIALICLAALTVCGITWRMRKPRGQPAKSRFSAADRSAVSTSSNRLYAVVDRDEALVEPYPYIHVEKDGTARELHASEREYLETPFLFGDGGRPYVKSSYEERTAGAKSAVSSNEQKFRCKFRFTLRRSRIRANA
jgi:hypothetical protein